ncbi:hypothetical protein D3C71_1870570 [compost metagenome]
MTQAMLAATIAPAAPAAKTLSTPCGVRMRRCLRGRRESNSHTVSTTLKLHKLNHNAGAQALPQARSAATMANQIRLKPTMLAWRG